MTYGCTDVKSCYRKAGSCVWLDSNAHELDVQNTESLASKQHVILMTQRNNMMHREKFDMMPACIDNRALHEMYYIIV